MTNDEMIAWAKFDLPSRTAGSADADYNAVKVHDTYANLDALIWIAKSHGRQEAFKQVTALSNQLSDAEKLGSYPGGLLKREKNQWLK